MHGFSHCKENACIDNEFITGLHWQLIDQPGLGSSDQGGNLNF